MHIDNVFELGYFVRKSGVDGALVLYIDADNPEYYLKMESIFVELNKQLVPFFIEKIKKQKTNEFLVQLEDVDSIEEAEILVSQPVFADLKYLAKLNEKQFYYHEVIGWKVEDKSKGPIGIVKGVLENKSQDILMVDLDGKELLIPITDDFFLNADRTNDTLYFDLPDGLIELYLNT